LRDNLEINVNWTNEHHDKSCTPLWVASCCGKLNVVEALVTSGRDLGDFGKKGNSGRHSHQSTSKL